jgi:hypothetical protein
MADTEGAEKQLAVDSLVGRMNQQLPEVMKTLWAFRVVALVLILSHLLLSLHYSATRAVLITCTLSIVASWWLWSSAAAIQMWTERTFAAVMPHPSDTWAAMRNNLSTDAKRMALRDIVVFGVALSLTLVFALRS